MIMLIKDIKDILNKEVMLIMLLLVLKIIKLKIKDGEYMNSLNKMVEEKLYSHLMEENEYNLMI